MLAENCSKCLHFMSYFKDKLLFCCSSVYVHSFASLFLLFPVLSLPFPAALPQPRPGGVSFDFSRHFQYRNAAAKQPHELPSTRTQDVHCYARAAYEDRDLILCRRRSRWSNESCNSWHGARKAYESNRASLKKKWRLSNSFRTRRAQAPHSALFLINGRQREDYARLEVHSEPRVQRFRGFPCAQRRSIKPMLRPTLRTHHSIDSHFDGGRNRFGSIH